MTRLLLPYLLLAACAVNAAAQSAGGSQDANLRRLIQRVESLESEVRQLRAEKSSTSISAEASEAAFAQSDGAMRSQYPELKLRGFGHAEYHWTDSSAEKNSFVLGAFDLFITSQLAEDVSVLSESVVETDEEGRFGFEIERLVLQYTPHEWLNFAVGRYHTSIGYYNTTYHHGTWLETAVSRPRILEFEDEGGLLPIHDVGVSVSGAIPSGRLGLHYVAEIGNGRDYTPGAEPVQNVKDKNSFKALNLALYARPDWLPGLQAGVSVHFDRLSAALLPTVNQTIASAHAVYVSPEFEWLNEVVLLRHESSLGTFQTLGGYSQIARRFGKFRPYLRYQFLDGSERDPLVQLAGVAGLQQTLSLGVRFDFTALAALKLQWDHTLDAEEDAPGNELTLQMSFTF